MFFEDNESLYFIFVDFGSAFKLNSNKKKVFTFSDKFSPHEQNTEQETTKSDIYSLGLTLSDILKITKIKVDSSIIDLLFTMRVKEIEKRPSIDFCIEFVSSYCQKQKDLVSFVNPKSFGVPPLCKTFSSIKEQTRFINQSFFQPPVTMHQSFGNKKKN